jgi:hypothetical protein
MPGLYLSGSAKQNSDVDLLLADQLSGMGTAITNEYGSIAWIEAFVIAKSFAACLNFIQLLSNQLSPNSLSIYARRFAVIYEIAVQGNNVIPTNLVQIQNYIAARQAEFGTVSNYANVYQYLKTNVGQAFIDIEYPDPMLQSSATFAPGSWYAPLSVLLVRLWQPRSNQEGLLMDKATFLQLANNYKLFLQSWLPSNLVIQNYQLIYSGANTNPANNISNYMYGINIISATAGGITITGSGTNFTTDFAKANLGYHMPIEIVDDTGVLQTYHIASVKSNTLMTTYEVIEFPITKRTYRCLGIQMDVPNVLDYACFNQ